MAKNIHIELHFDTIDYEGCYKYLLYAVLGGLIYGIFHALWMLNVTAILVAFLLFYVLYRVIIAVKRCAYKVEFNLDSICLSYVLSEKTINFNYSEIETLKYKVVSGDSPALSEQMRIKFKHDTRVHYFVCPRSTYDEICEYLREYKLKNNEPESQ